MVVFVKLPDDLGCFIDGKVREVFLRNHKLMKLAKVSRPMLIAAACNYYVNRRHSVLDELLGLER